MGIGYQALDRKVVDYDMWFLDGGRIGLRGPRVRFEGTDYLCFIGAAQTFGRFVARPFAMQVGRVFGRTSLNLGFSGAGPEFFLGNATLMDIIRNAAVLVVQSMSARSVSAGIFRVAGNNGVAVFLEGPRRGQSLLAQQAYAALRRDYGEQRYREQIAAVQAQWVALHRELLGQTKARTYFLWLSEKKMGENLDLSRSPVGAFPHFVTREMVGEVARLCDGVFDATFEAMRPQPLVNDRTGELEAVFAADKFPDRPNALRALNTYYATQEMHDFATGVLARGLARAIA
ncbi:MAG TPA: DUF6473 family protein [Stellaceae bacterium]|nr:DUF6473 family protein [Stellaceae bacterium]